MRPFRILLAALFGVGHAVAQQPQARSKSPAELMREMRLQWLTKTPAPTSEGKKEDIAAVVMDWPLDEATVTVLASSGGDASIYTTGTFGIIGGIGHENVRKAAIAFVECAQKHRALASPTTDFSYPNRQTVRFFFVGIDGVKSVSFSAAQIEKAGTAAHELYLHGQIVLTELRQTTQPQQRGH